MLYLMLISCSLAVSRVRSSCTETAVQKAMMCTSQLDIGILAGNSSNKSAGREDVDRIAHACRNGDLLSVVRCIEMVMDECKDDQSNGAVLLRHMIDTKKARRSVDFFCANMDVYTANYECLTGHNQEQAACILEAKRNYQTQTSTAASMNVFMAVHCKFHQAVMQCVHKTAQEKCSSKAVDFMKTVLEGFEPPSCAPTSTSRSEKSAREHTINEQADGVKRTEASGCKLSLHGLSLLACTILTSVVYCHLFISSIFHHQC